MKTYLIPGLGGDKRMYAGQISKFDNLVVLEFIEPKRNETLVDYTKRLSASIDTSEPFNLLGVSLGGIMCIEIAKYLKPEKIYIISSVKTRKELPLWIRFFRYFPVQKLIPGSIYLWAFLFLVKLKNITFRSNFITARLRAMAKDANPRFVYWAVHRVVTWQNETVPNNVIHIHGDRDFLFPIRRCKVDYSIEKGTHAMILTHVKSINQVLAKYL